MSYKAIINKKIIKFIENMMILKTNNQKVKTTFSGFPFLVFSFKKKN